VSLALDFIYNEIRRITYEGKTDLEAIEELEKQHAENTLFLSILKIFKTTAEREARMPLVADRIRDIIGEIRTESGDANGVELHYTWYHGYEKLTMKRLGGNCRQGGLDYSGAYHPNAVCDGEGVCKHCGKVFV
jgi:hypothetical protein